jgi:hypothetical protein
MPSALKPNISEMIAGTIKMKNTRWCRFLKAVKKSNPQIRAMLNWVIASIAGVICFLNLLINWDFRYQFSTRRLSFTYALGQHDMP